MTKIQKLRDLRFYEQNGHCFYCDQPMWLKEINYFIDKYKLTQKQTLKLRATAEHLIPREKGGKVEKENIVAACLFCNNHRHKFRPKNAPSPDEFRKKVRRQLAKGKWHQISLSPISQLCKTS